MSRPLNRRRVLVYVSGPITAPEQVDRWDNIMRARLVSIYLWELGFTVICPHLNTMFFDGADGMEHQDWLEGDFRIIEGCDAVFLIYNWNTSKGATMEKAFAEEENIPVFTSYGELEKRYPNE